MEKRMLLAVLLSLIVLVGWSLLFSPQKKQKTVINKPFVAFNVLSPIVAKEQVQQKLYLS